MKIIRYSINGFKPQYQSHHIDNVNYHLYNFNITDVPEHIRDYIQQAHDEKVPFYKKHYDDFKYGIWVFIDGYKNNMSLNHLKRKVPCWRAEISDDTYGYDCNWREQIKITDWKCQYGGIYIPAHQLNTLVNIQKVKAEKIK